MNKVFALFLVLSIGSAYGRHYDTPGDIKKQINELKRKIQAEERAIRRVEGKAKFKKQDIELSKEAQISAKQGEIQEREYNIKMLKQQLSDLEG